MLRYDYVGECYGQILTTFMLIQLKRKFIISINTFWACYIKYTVCVLCQYFVFSNVYSIYFPYLGIYTYYSSVFPYFPADFSAYTIHKPQLRSSLSGRSLPKDWELQLVSLNLGSNTDSRRQLCCSRGNTQKRSVTAAFSGGWCFQARYIPWQRVVKASVSCHGSPAKPHLHVVLCENFVTQ